MDNPATASSTKHDGAAIRRVILAAIVYGVVGVVTAWLAGTASSPQMRTTWRLAGWLLSLATFIVHVSFEQLRLRAPVVRTALHAAVAVALGAFALAIVGPMRSHWGEPDFARASALSVLLWPIMTGVPAFLAALVGGWLLTAARQRQ